MTATRYSLAEIRNGTGWEPGVQFVTERSYLAVLDALESTTRALGLLRGAALADQQITIGERLAEALDQTEPDESDDAWPLVEAWYTEALRAGESS